MQLISLFRHAGFQQYIGIPFQIEEVFRMYFQNRAVGPPLFGKTQKNHLNLWVQASLRCI